MTSSSRSLLPLQPTTGVDQGRSGARARPRDLGKVVRLAAVHGHRDVASGGAEAGAVGEPLVDEGVEARQGARYAGGMPPRSGARSGVARGWRAPSSRSR